MVSYFGADKGIRVWYNYIVDYRKFRVVIGQKIRHISRKLPTGEYNSEGIYAKWRLPL